ncbi:protein obstructor-E-like [Amphibalanus amphitrite]|uniref:protein obstructor-E-like n=1 Tax=Amphibalanus amphitrite TaxID=1232801 RepID=UPI001C917317|nr:protein obstructor-E-like [Amphibalanus amphitrite]
MWSLALLTVLCCASAVVGQDVARPSCDDPEVEAAYEDPSGCDRYFLCSNGTLTEEVCENGLLFSGRGAVHEHCDYHWNVDCGERPFELTPARDGACPYSFGIFPSGEGCADYSIKCAFGEAEPDLCEEGLAYDDRNHACNWPDLIPECSIGDAEHLVGFSCPSQIPVGSASIRFGQFPRFATGQCDRLVTCVNYYPRLIKCPPSQSVDDNSLTCVSSELVPGCGVRK